MKVGKLPENVIGQDIEVDNWIVNHDKKGIFSEHYEGKKKNEGSG